MTLVPRRVEIGEHKGPNAIEAISVAGIETCVYLPLYKLAFDIGHCPQFAVEAETVCISHGHPDHFSGLYAHSTQRSMVGKTKPKYFTPSVISDAVGHALDTQAFLDGKRCAEHLELFDAETAAPYAHVLTATRSVRAFPTQHRVPACAYGIYSTRKKLLAEFVSKSGQEIAAAVAAGIPIDAPHSTLDVAYSGDTTAAGLDAHRELYQAKLLIVECTYIDGDVRRAQERGHIHLDELVSRADAITAENVLLIHFSQRYRRDEIERALDAKLPKDLRARTTALVNNS